MTAAANLTYGSLVTDIRGYADRSDQPFIDQIPRFIMLAENRIASEARGLGLIQSVVGTMVPGVNGSALAKPARWRESASLWIGTGAGLTRRKYIKLRGFEYVRYYWPDPALTDEPRYYSDYDWAHYLITPSPDLAYPFELLFYERPQPLDTSNTTNWTTNYAPQLISFACYLEAAAWVKNADLIKTWQDGYDRALKQVEFESKQRLADRSNAVQK